MKNSILKLSAIFFLGACTAAGGLGLVFDDSKSVAIDEAIAAFKSSGQKDAVISGEISKVCQSEGCWFNYKTKNGDMKVEFDHKFTIPKDSKGNTAIASGHFYYDTTSVETLKEWATDEKKSKEEIEKITTPEIQMMFRAEGIKITK